MNDQIENTLADHSELTLPSSSPPTMVDLRRRLYSRKRRRQLLGAGSACAVLVCVSMVVVWRISSQPDSGEPSFGPVAVAPEAASLNRVTLPPLRSPTIDSSDIRLFAKVRQPMPVFSREEDSPYLYHVGWFDSESWVPVDLSGVSDDDQELLEAVLAEESPTTAISL